MTSSDDTIAGGLEHHRYKRSLRAIAMPWNGSRSEYESERNGSHTSSFSSTWIDSQRQRSARSKLRGAAPAWAKSASDRSVGLVEVSAARTARCRRRRERRRELRERGCELDERPRAAMAERGDQKRLRVAVADRRAKRPERQVLGGSAR